MDTVVKTIGNDSEEESLVKWKNPPKLSDLKQDLKDATPAHSTMKANLVNWLDNLNVEGSAKIKVKDNSSSIVPKLIRKQAEWRYAALSEPFLSTPDVFNITPVTWEDKKAAEQNQLILNNQFNTAINKTRFIDEYVRAAVDEGTVITRVSWEFQEEEITEIVPTFQFVEDESMVPIFQQIEQMMQASPSEYQTNVPDELKQAFELSNQQGIPLAPQQIGEEEVTRMKTVVNRPTVEICNMNNVIIDPSCMGNLDKAGFVIYSFESSLSELEKDGKYKNLDKIKPSGSSILNQPDHILSENRTSFNFNDEPRKKFVVYEYWGYWDIDGSGIVKPFVAAWAENTLIRMEENPYPDKKIPFVLTQYLPVRRAIYGEPDGALLADNQKIIGAVTRGMIDIMGKSANAQTGIRKDMLDVTNRRRFDKGLDYEFNPNVDPRQGVHMHVFPEIPQSAQFMLGMQNMEAESLTGVKSFSQGVSGASLGDVAAGVRGALDAASKRELGILRRLSDGIIQIGRKIISMNAQFLSDTEVIRITNEQFVEIRKDDLPGNFDIKLSISTAEEDNNKAQELAFMLQTMGNNMDPSMSKIILSDIAKLRKMPDLAEKIENFEPQPDPMAQKQAELQIQLLEAQLRKENAMAMEAEANAQLTMAKIGTEQVKQGDIKASTDQKTLDFVEQESGLKQERDLQKSGEQARSQAQLKVLDHEYKKQEQQHDLVKEYVKAKLNPKKAST